MARIKQFEAIIKKHTRIGIDASVFIYLFEQNPSYEPLAAKVFDMVSGGTIHLFASSIALSEVLVRPLEQKDSEVVALYEHAFRSIPHFSLVDIDYMTAKAAAVIRAEYSILLPDALHVAAALKAGATLFVTNDKRLKRIKDIAVACLDDYV